jgi:hypothetical protein
VQPPYFALEELRVVDDCVIAEVTADPWSPRELGVVGSAEAARHLAILGSCAVALASGDSGRTYYPVHRARLLARGNPAPSREALPRFTLSARMTNFDRGLSSATAEADLCTAEGALVLRFGVDYHVIPEKDFRTLFAAHAEATDDHGAPSPYATHRPLAMGTFDGRSIRAVMDKVVAADCAGHFRGYPALPVSIMARHVFDLVAEGCRQLGGWSDVRIAVVGGGVETERFAWAHERVVFEAFPRAGVDGAWQCDVKTPEGTAARFTMEVVAEPT